MTSNLSLKDQLMTKYGGGFELHSWTNLPQGSGINKLFLVHHYQQVVGNKENKMKCAQSRSRTQQRPEMLTLFRPVDFSIFINWKSPCPNLRVSDVLFHFYFVSK